MQSEVIEGTGKYLYCLNQRKEATASSLYCFLLL